MLVLGMSACAHQSKIQPSKGHIDGQNTNQTQPEIALTTENSNCLLYTSNDISSMTAQAQRHLQRQANVSLDSVLKTWERAYIEAAMQMTHGNLSQAAKLLNVNRTTLYSRMSTIEEN